MCMCLHISGRGAHYRSDFPKIDDERWKVIFYCRKEGMRGLSAGAGAEMILFKQNVKERNQRTAGRLS